MVVVDMFSLKKVEHPVTPNSATKKKCLPLSMLKTKFFIRRSRFCLINGHRWTLHAGVTTLSAVIHNILGILEAIPRGGWSRIRPVRRYVEAGKMGIKTRACSSMRIAFTLGIGWSGTPLLRVEKQRGSTTPTEPVLSRKVAGDRPLLST